MTNNFIKEVRELELKYFRKEITLALLVEDTRFLISEIKDKRTKNVLLEIIDRAFNFDDPLDYARTLKSIEFDGKNKELPYTTINRVINNYNYFISL